MVDAYYKFEIYREDTSRYKIRRLEKVGNHPLLNRIFEYHEKLWLHKIMPPSIAGYIGYVIGSNVGIISWLPIVFETSLYAPNSGIVKAKELENVVLFKLTHVEKREVFEVFVCRGKNELSLLMLQAMNDGQMETEFEAIKCTCV